MQKNKFDNWLRKTFAYRTQILCHHLPDDDNNTLLSKAKIKELDHPASNKFRYELLYKKEKDAELCVQLLKSKSMLFSTNIVQKNGKFSNFICNSQKSVTYVIIWKIISLLLLLSLLYLSFLLVQNPKVLQILKDAWAQFKSLTSS